jgi:hypothetical protein
MERKADTKCTYYLLAIWTFLLFLLSANICFAVEESVPTRATDLNNTDGLRVDPKHFRFQFENRQIRVLRLTLQSDEFVPMHNSPDTLLVCVSECHIRLERPDKRINDIHMDPGETRWVRSSIRSEKNLSGKSLEIVFVEIKQPAFEQSRR